MNLKGEAEVIIQCYEKGFIRLRIYETGVPFGCDFEIEGDPNQIAKTLAFAASVIQGLQQDQGLPTRPLA